MEAVLTVDLLERFRERRAAGASVKSLADELGIPWQRLDKALRHGLRSERVIQLRPQGQMSQMVQSVPPVPQEPVGCIEPERAVLTEAALQGPGALAEKYRPRSLRSIFGQPEVVRRLRRFAEAPYPVAFLFAGETGTGKTSAALALARELGCDLDQKELGGVQVLASGEQTAEAVRECCARMWLQPMGGSGWKVFVINEADRMHVQAETIWLDRLEDIPVRTVVVFTTNHAEKLSQRFRDRCDFLAFDSDARRIRESTRLLLARIWKAETRKQPARKRIDRIVSDATVAGRLSFRRAIQMLQGHLPAGKANCRKTKRPKRKGKA